MKTLQLVSSTITLTRGSKKIVKPYWDFVISGQSLSSILKVSPIQATTPFGWQTNKDHERELIHIFTFRKRPNLETGRVMLYVCPECGDIDCGATTAVIRDLGDRIVWKDFGNETGYGGVDERYFNIEPIVFERQSYFQAFSKLN